MFVPVYITVLQWTLLLALGVLLTLALRELGDLLGVHSRHGSHRDGSQGLPPGDSAPKFEYLEAASGAQRVFTPGGSPSLLLFAEPSCTGCQKAVSLLQGIVKTPENPINVLILTTEPKEYVQAIPEFRDTSLPIALVASDVPSRYSIDATPTFVAIGGDGRIRASAVTVERDDIRQLVHKSSVELPQQANLLGA